MVVCFLWILSTGRWACIRRESESLPTGVYSLGLHQLSDVVVSRYPLKNYNNPQRAFVYVGYLFINITVIKFFNVLNSFKNDEKPTLYVSINNIFMRNNIFQSKRDE